MRRCPVCDCLVQIRVSGSSGAAQCRCRRETFLGRLAPVVWRARVDTRFTVVTSPDSAPFLEFLRELDIAPPHLQRMRHMCPLRVPPSSALPARLSAQMVGLHDDASDVLCDALWGSLVDEDIRRYPLGFDDPQEYVAAWIRTISDIAHAASDLLRDVSAVRLVGPGILRACLHGQRAECTLVGYCHACGTRPLLLGQDAECGCSERRLRCECGASSPRTGASSFRRRVEGCRPASRGRCWRGR